MTPAVTITLLGKEFQYTEAHPYLSMTELVILGDFQRALVQKPRFQLSNFLKSASYKDLIETLVKLGIEEPPTGFFYRTSRGAMAHYLVAKFITDKMLGISDFEAAVNLCRDFALCGKE